MWNYFFDYLHFDVRTILIPLMVDREIFYIHLKRTSKCQRYYEDIEPHRGRELTS